jgi:hypothetical protein
LQSFALPAVPFRRNVVTTTLVAVFARTVTVTSSDPHPSGCGS